MVVPTYRNPGYGAVAAGQVTAGAEGRLASMMTGRGLEVDALKSILNNSERVASVSGSGALDPMLQQYAGSQGQLLSTPYAGEIDVLRKTGMLADIAAKNRSNTGGGGGSGTGSALKATEVQLRNPITGESFAVSATSAPQAKFDFRRANPGYELEVVSTGRSMGVSAPMEGPPAPPKTAQETWTDENGVVYDAMTGEIVE